MPLIPQRKSIIPACDVDSLERLSKIVTETAGNPFIGGYKVGFELGLTHGLPTVVQTIRAQTNKPIIYDHQKAGTDIPDTGKAFAKVCRISGIDVVIFFPQAGPITEEAWIKAAQDEGLGVMVGGIMTHKGYLESDGGFIKDAGAMDIYKIAASSGVTDFVVPGNKPDLIKAIKNHIQQGGVSHPVFYSPGFIAQGGQLTEAVAAVGECDYHPIIGRGIYEADNMADAVARYTAALST